MIKRRQTTHTKKKREDKGLSKERPAIFLKMMPVTCLQTTSSCPKRYHWMNCSLKAAAVLPR